MNRKFTRIAAVAVLICLVLAVCVCAGCVQEKEKVHVVIKDPELTMTSITDPDATSVNIFINKAWNAFAAQYDKYDVSATIIEFPQTEYDKYIQDAYGTDLAADLLYGPYFTIASFIHEGYAVPLDDMITQEIRDDYDQGYWDASTSSENGKTYLLPNTNLQNTLVFNEDLFRKAGLDKYCGKDEIQSWTLEEWDTILATLKEKLPANTYVFPMYAKNNQGDTHIMILLRSQGSSFFDEKGRFNLETKEGIAALQKFKDMYDMGYFPPHAEDLEIMDCTTFFQNNQMAFAVGNAALTAGFKGAGLSVGYVNFPSADGNGMASSFVSGFMAFDTGDAKKLEVVKDFLTYIYTNEEWLAYSAGDIPCSRQISAKYIDEIPGGKMFIANNDKVVDYTANNPNWVGVRAAFWPNIHALLSGEMTAEETAKAIDASCNAAIEEGYQKSKLHE